MTRPSRAHAASARGRALVIGGGAVGSSAAVKLREDGWEVELWYRDDGPRTVSSVAPAFWYPFRAQPADRVDGWAIDSLAEYRRLSADPARGVRACTALELVPPETPAPSWAAKLPGFRVRDDAGLPDGATRAFEFPSFVIDTSLYLPWLRGHLTALGVASRVVEADSLAAIPAGFDVVVVAAGLDSRALVGDASVTALRGQLVFVQQVGLVDVLLDERDPKRMAYVIPRTHDVALGATTEDSESLAIDPHTTLALLERCGALEPRLRGAAVLRETAGLRPLRPEVRLEVSPMPTRAVSAGPTDRGPLLICNYGHGGAGVTLSWGCAAEVTRLARTAGSPPR